MDGSVRASDAEREAVVERLREAAAEGRLSFDELGDRIEAATHALTREQLAALTRDLPGRAVAPVTAARVTALGDVQRSGTWVVPRESEFRSWMGHIRLDLREAQLAAPEVTIRVFSLFGVVDVLVPEGVAVDARVRTAFGQLKQEAGEIAPPGAPRVVLTGRSVFGTVRIRHRKCGKSSRGWSRERRRARLRPLRRPHPGSTASPAASSHTASPARSAATAAIGSAPTARSRRAAPTLRSTRASMRSNAVRTGIRGRWP